MAAGKQRVKLYLFAAGNMDTRVSFKLPPFPDARKTLPTPEDIESNAILNDFVSKHCPAVSAETETRQKDALKRLCTLFQSWCQSAFHTYVSGSYRIGVHTDEADIDVLFVLPAAVTRAHVFNGFVKVLQACDQVTDLQPIPKARVPIIALKFHGQEFDILTCHLRESVLPPRDSMLQSYEWMNGLEEECILSFNGPRVTETILNSLPRPNQFCLALRLLRHWAKRRHVYSNKSGYLGGVNLALLLCYIAQKNPTAVASTLVARFFDTYSKWRWSKTAPVQLDSHVDHTCPVWLRSMEWSAKHAEVMVILTPCFPRFNTTYAASHHSSKVMVKELAKAAKELAGGQVTATNLAAVCQPLDCFRTCSRFLRLTVCAPDTKEGASWQGYIEAQTRYIIQYLSQEELAVAEFRYVPTWCTRTDTAGQRVRETYITADDDGKIRAYKVRGALERPRDYFMEVHANNGPPVPYGATVDVQFCARASLPPELVAMQEPVETVLQISHVDVASPVLIPAAPAASAAVSTPVQPHRDLLREWLASRKPSRRPPCGRMTVKLLPDRPRTSGIIVRPRVIAGKDREESAIYIGRQCTVGGVLFPQSVFAVPDGLSPGQYRQYAEGRAAADVQFRAAVAKLHGQRLACWCTPDQRASVCHGLALLDMASQPQLQSWLRTHGQVHGKRAHEREPPLKQRRRGHVSRPARGGVLSAQL